MTREEVVARHPKLANIELDGCNDFKLVDTITGFKYNNPTIWAIIKALRNKRTGW